MAAWIGSLPSGRFRFWTRKSYLKGQIFAVLISLGFVNVAEVTQLPDACMESRITGRIVEMFEMSEMLVGTFSFYPRNLDPF